MFMFWGLQYLQILQKILQNTPLWNTIQQHHKLHDHKVDYIVTFMTELLFRLAHQINYFPSSDVIAFILC